MITIEHPAVRKAALELFAPGTPVNKETLTKFEKTYNCTIEKIDEWIVPRVFFNSEEDETWFMLRWS